MSVSSGLDQSMVAPSDWSPAIPIPNDSLWSQGQQSSSSSGWTPSNVNTAFGYIDNFIDSARGWQDANNSAAASAAQQYNDWSANQARIVREFNAREAAKNRDWQERMSNTAHQREVRDLQAAGLNPVLSASGGNGASVGSGSSASASNATGKSADVDMGLTQSMVGLLGKAIDSLTTLEASNNNARLAQANVDKTNNLNWLIANLNSATQVYGYDSHLKGAKYSADSARAAAKYSADAAQFASMYGAAMQYKIHEDFPNSFPAVLDKLFGGFFGEERGSSLPKSVFDWFGNLIRSAGDSYEKAVPYPGSDSAYYKPDYYK